MNDLQFYDLYNNISVISEQWAGDNEKAVYNGTPITIETISALCGARTRNRNSSPQMLSANHSNNHLEPVLTRGFWNYYLVLVE